MTDEIAAFLEELPFVTLLGIQLTSADDGEAEAILEMREELSWTAGEPMAHSGVTFTLAEVTGAAALISLTSPPVFTVDMRVDYLDAARGDLRATASVLRDGADIGVVQTDVHDEHGTYVATAQTVFKITS